MATTRQPLFADTIQVIQQSITYELIPAEKGGDVVTVLDHPSCSTQGETIDEALSNADDAWLACLLVDKAQGFTIPQALEE